MSTGPVLQARSQIYVMTITQVYRENKWKYIMSDELLPGDLLSIGNHYTVY